MFTGEILFTIFRIFGLWKSSSKQKWKIVLYNFYTIFNLTIYGTFVFSLFIYLLQMTENVDTFTHSLFYFSTSFAMLIKIINFAFKNKSVVDLQDIFSNKICQPRDFSELQILQEISQTCR